MPDPERTFKRFGASEDGARWDLTEVVDEHSEHIEKIETVLVRLHYTIGQMLGIIERVHGIRLEDTDAE